MTRYWMSWWGGADGDCRPVEEAPFPWWWTAEREQAPGSAICAVVDAEDEAAARALVWRYWPEAEERFCVDEAPDYMPPAERFPPRERGKVTGERCRSEK